MQVYTYLNCSLVHEEFAEKALSRYTTMVVKILNNKPNPTTTR